MVGFTDYASTSLLNTFVSLILESALCFLV